MKGQFIHFLNFTAIFIYVVLCLHIGFYFDMEIVASYFIAAISTPILAYYVLVFIKKAAFNYSQVLESLSRNLTLQRIDPLLN